jgi:hypothetical protein
MIDNIEKNLTTTVEFIDNAKTHVGIAKGYQDRFRKVKGYK